MPNSPAPPPAAFFRYAALVLFALAALDLVYLVVAWAHGRIAFSILWLAAIVGGILLWQGRRSVAGFMAYLAAFALGATLGMTVALLFIFPPGFLPIALRVAPAVWRWGAAYYCAVGLLALVLLMVTTSEAARRNLRNTIFDAPSRWLRARAFVVYGLVMTACLVGVIGLFIRSVQPEAAIAAAERRCGTNYRYFVTTFNLRWENGRTMGSATVIAYNENEIRQIPVQWEDH